MLVNININGIIIYGVYAAVGIHTYKHLRDTRTAVSESLPMQPTYRTSSLTNAIPLSVGKSHFTANLAFSMHTTAPHVTESNSPTEIGERWEDPVPKRASGNALN